MRGPRKTGIECPRRRLVIVADDLTGAADAAAAFAPRVSTAVLLDLHPTGQKLSGAVVRNPASEPDHEVLSFDTNSRYLPAEQAAEVTGAAVALAVSLQARIYKKLDSTLRGNVAAEVAATLDAAGADLALVAPAFPSTGRTVMGGVALVGGQPLTHRPAGGDLRRLFSDGGLPSAVVELGPVRAGAVPLVEAVDGARRAGARVVCVDAESESDLRVIRDALELLGGAAVPVGSGGLARVMAEVWPSACPRGARPDGGRRGPVLLVLGSYSPVAHAQLQKLAPATAVVAVAEPYESAQLRRAEAELREVLGTGDVALVPDPASPVLRGRTAQVAAALAAVSSAVLREQRPPLGGAVLSGGDTARAVLLTSGVTSIEVAGEFEPGVVLATPDLAATCRAGTALAGLPIVTKAGAFGDPGTLDRARRALHRDVYLPRPATASVTP